MRRLWDAYLSLDGLWLLVQIVLGLGCIGYIGASWLLHWLHDGRYFLALFASISLGLLTAAAIVRIPIALAIVFGAAMMFGVMFATGNGDAVLP